MDRVSAAKSGSSGRPHPLPAFAHQADRSHRRPLADQTGRNDPLCIAFDNLVGTRTFLGVPMLKENGLVGLLVIYRLKVRPFTDKQIDLVKNFAAKPSSPSKTRGCLTNCASARRPPNPCSSRPPPPMCSRSSAARPSIFKSVLQTLVESAARLCDANNAGITRQTDGKFFCAELTGIHLNLQNSFRICPLSLGGTADRAGLTRRQSDPCSGCADRPGLKWEEAQSWAVIAPFSAFQCYARTSRSAS